MKKAIASLAWSLYIECPNCHTDFDLADVDSDYDYTFSKAIFYNKWENLEGVNIECPDCGEFFEIEEVEY